jgi:uncharacterized protein YjiS (DUF1127 family)
MSAPLAKSDFIFKLANSQSYIDSGYDPTPLPSVRPASRSLVLAVANSVALLAGKVRTWVEKQATLAEMAAMSDRELADIGLSRCDLSRVFDADFVVDHPRGNSARA